MAFMVEMKATSIKNAWKSNSREEIKLTRENTTHHGPWAPPWSDHRGHGHVCSLLFSLVLLLGSSQIVVLATVCPCWVYLCHFCYLLWSIGL